MLAVRRIVIGDIHGCFEELVELLVEAGADLNTEIISLGDLVNRGPHAHDVVRFLRVNPKVRIIPGNHEEKHVRHERHERRIRASDKPTPEKNPMRPFSPARLAEHAGFTEEEHDWMASLFTVPTFIRFEHEGRQWIANHAGVPSDRPIEVQDVKRLIRCRTVHPETGAYMAGGNPDKPPKGSVYWSERWNGPESVIYGHIVHDDFEVRRDVTPSGAVCLGIDTGCCFGGTLTAAVFEDGEVEPRIVSVQAHETYAPRMQALTSDD